MNSLRLNNSKLHNGKCSSTNVVYRQWSRCNCNCNIESNRVNNLRSYSDYTDNNGFTAHERVMIASCKYASKTPVITNSTITNDNVVSVYIDENGDYIHIMDGRKINLSKEFCTKV